MYLFQYLGMYVFMYWGIYASLYACIGCYMYILSVVSKKEKPTWPSSLKANFKTMQAKMSGASNIEVQNQLHSNWNEEKQMHEEIDRGDESNLQEDADREDTILPEDDASKRIGGGKGV